MDLVTNLLPRALPANHSQDGAETFLLVRQDVDRQSGPNLHTQPPLGAVGQRAAQRRPRAVTSPCSSRSAATTNCFSCGAPGRAAPSGSSLRGNRAEFRLGGRRGARRGCRGLRTGGPAGTSAARRSAAPAARRRPRAAPLAPCARRDGGARPFYGGPAGPWRGGAAGTARGTVLRSAGPGGRRTEVEAAIKSLANRCTLCK